jgi:hypothetical protein
LDATSPATPSGYDIKRYLGAAATDSTSPGNIIADTVWKGPFCWLGVRPAADVDSTSLASQTYIDTTITAPPESIAKVVALLGENASDFFGAMFFEFRHTSASSGDLIKMGYDVNDDSGDTIQYVIDVLVDASSQVSFSPHYQDGSGGTVTLHCVGWNDLRRNTP